MHDAAIAHGQVPDILDELVAAHIVRRTGSARRQLLSPVNDGPTGLATAYWIVWSSVPTAPWRDAPSYMVALIDVDQDPPIAAPRTQAATRTAEAEVAFGHARAASTWLISRLRDGMGQPTRPAN